MRRPQIGDCFELDLPEGKAGVVQLVAIDATQLNSEVVRCFGPLDPGYDTIALLAEESSRYAHMDLRHAVKSQKWRPLPNSSQIGSAEVYFRTCNDNPQSGISEQWYVWRLGGDAVFVGKLPEAMKHYHIGSILPSIYIVELCLGNALRLGYPS
jgi:hypothetical protein